MSDFTSFTSFFSVWCWYFSCSRFLSPLLALIFRVPSRNLGAFWTHLRILYKGWYTKNFDGSRPLFRAMAQHLLDEIIENRRVILVFTAILFLSPNDLFVQNFFDIFSVFLAFWNFVFFLHDQHEVIHLLRKMIEFGVEFIGCHHEHYQPKTKNIYTAIIRP